MASYESENAATCFHKWHQHKKFDEVVMQTFPLSEFQAVVTENVHVHVLHVHGNDIC